MSGNERPVLAEPVQTLDGGFFLGCAVGITFSIVLFVCTWWVISHVIGGGS